MVDFVAVVKGKERHGIGCDAVPSFCSSCVLDEIDPLFTAGDFFMLVPVPLCRLYSVELTKCPEVFEFIIEVIEDNKAVVLVE